MIYNRDLDVDEGLVALELVLNFFVTSGAREGLLAVARPIFVNRLRKLRVALLSRR